MEKFKMSFVSLQRLLKIAHKLKQQEGELDQYEINTLTYLFEQCDEEEKKHIVAKFGDVLDFLQ